MKFLILASLFVSFSVSASSLSCKAELFSDKYNEEQYAAADSIDIELKPAKVEIREIELDKKGNGELAGIIIDAWEKYGVSFNYAVYAEDGFITDVSAENEVEHAGAGLNNLKNQKSIEFSSSSLEDGSHLKLNCEIK